MRGVLLAALCIAIMMLSIGCNRGHTNYEPTTNERIDSKTDQYVSTQGDELMTLRITSSTFKDGELIPKNHTCQGTNVNPPLSIEGVPKGTKSLAIIMDDPDAPMGVWDHWILWNIDPQTSFIDQNSCPPNAIQGKNSGGMNRYSGPCPPSGTHRYFFKVYALDTKIDLQQNAAKSDLERAMQGHIIEKTQIMGLYRKT